MARRLSTQFMDDLKTGKLASILELVRMDASLCLCIREDYINIYYRGCNLAKIEEVKKSGKSQYELFFDAQYAKHSFSLMNSTQPTGSRIVASPADALAWVTEVPAQKQHIDLYLGDHPKVEREVQQLVLRENNGHRGNGKWDSVSKATDYFICDIEYTNSRFKKRGRFDMIAVCWPSSSGERRRTRGLRLAIIEVKYGDGALKGNAGIMKHITDLNHFLQQNGALDALKDEMRIVFNQLQELRLVASSKPITSFDTGKPEYIFILANHDPDSKKLVQVLGAPPSCSLADVKFATSNFAGYGLYREAMYGRSSFAHAFGKRICSEGVSQE